MGAGIEAFESAAIGTCSSLCARPEEVCFECDLYCRKAQNLAPRQRIPREFMLQPIG